MAATLLAVIVALAIGHLAPDAASSVRQYGWFGGWLRWLNAQFPEGSIWRGRYGIALALVVPLLVVGLFQFALDQPLWGFVGLLFDIAVLFYCWGPRDLDLDVAAVLDAPDAASRRSAAERLWPEGEPAKIDGASLVEAVFRNALRRWFGVLFWFCLLGPFGAVLYRLSASLPGLALDRPTAFADGWVATTGETETILILAFFTGLIGLVLGAPLALMPTGSLFALLWGGAAGWVQLMVSASILTTLYGHYIEKRPLV